MAAVKTFALVLIADSAALLQESEGKSNFEKAEALYQQHSFFIAKALLNVHPHKHLCRLYKSISRA